MSLTKIDTRRAYGFLISKKRYMQIIRGIFTIKIIIQHYIYI